MSGLLIDHLEVAYAVDVQAHPSLSIDALTLRAAATTRVSHSARRVVVAWEVRLGSPPGLLFQVDLFQAATVGLEIIVYLKPNVCDVEVAEDIVTARKKITPVYAVAII